MQSVAVVGAFNNWDRAAFQLKLQPDGKTWKGTFPIDPGVYPYLFVENGNKWVPDPKAPPFPDANGNINSKLVVEPADYELRPARPDDGYLTDSALRHRSGREDCIRVDASHARIKLRTRRNDIKAASIVASAKEWPMVRVAQDELYDFWAGRVKFSTEGLLKYAISLNIGGLPPLFGPNGLDNSHWKRGIPKRKPLFTQNFSAYPLPTPPHWVQDAVFYQIFPERFANGNPSNDGPDAQPWGTKPTGKNRMGGDLAGINQRLDHLKELGIDAIYLNPVFESLSNHGYDTVDYLKVDPRFGSNTELASIVTDFRREGVRTILDGVFNHSSPEFEPFKDIIEKGSASSFKDWYFITDFPVQVKEGQKSYRTFAGVPTMPKLNQDNATCAEYFLKVGEVFVREAKASGWRLDVADEVSQDFWRAFRKRIKSNHPDAFLLGEAWGDAHEYLQGDQHDAVMNYRWRKAVLDLLAYRRTSVSEFDKELRFIREDYPNGVLNSMYNLLGSHDTERLRTIFKGDRKRQNLAIALQFTYPGVPSIYYGDEIGMEGGKDPDCRRCMEWDRSKWDMLQYNFYKSLIQLRKQEPALRRGSYRTLEASDRTGIFRFERQLENEKVEVALNLKERPSTLTLSKNAKIHMGPPSQNGKITIEPLGFAVYSRPN